MDSKPKRLRVGILLCAASVGAALGGAAIAGAATGGSGSATTTTPGAAATAPDGGYGRHAGETPLTGTTAEKVKAAALAAVPGGTIIRVETDSDGSTYEAHVAKTDGTQVTVKVDADFKVTSVEEGCAGGGPGGRHGGPRDGGPEGGVPQGGVPQGGSETPSSANSEST